MEYIQNDLQSCGREEYLNLVGESPNFFKNHGHLAVITVKENIIVGNPHYVAIPSRLIENASRKHRSFVYVMKANARKSCIKPIGGIDIETLLREAETTGRGRLINAQKRSRDNKEDTLELPAVFFSLNRYYDDNLFKIESSDTLPQRTTMDNRRSIDLYLGEPYSSDFDSLSIEVSERISPELLLERRFRMLESVASNSNRNNAISDQLRHRNFRYIVSEILLEEEQEKGVELSAPCSHEFDDVTLLSDLLSKDSVLTDCLDWDEKVEALSYRLFNIYVALASERESSSRRWIAFQEEVTMRFRLEERYSNEREVLNAVERNHLPELSTRVKRSDDGGGVAAIRDAESLFRYEFADSPLPAVWFLVDALHCLELGLKSLSSSTMVVERGKCYLSYKHLQKDYFPRALFDDIMKAPKHDDDDELTTELLPTKGRELLKRIRDKVTPTSDLPRDSRSDLPAIEDLAVGRYMPLCKSMLRLKLYDAKHLHYHERRHYAHFLLDCGYKKDDVRRHIHRQFSEKGVSEERLRTKYSHMVQWSESGKWVDGRRTIPYGWGCQRLIDGNYDTNSQNQVGCPFVTMSSDTQTLRELIVESGVTDESAIQEITFRATREKRAGAACAHHFLVRYGTMPESKRNLGEWRPASPQSYFNEALRSQQRRKRDRDHLDIEYQQTCGHELDVEKKVSHVFTS